MKRLTTLLFILFSISVYSRNNITNTPGTSGVSTFNDASANYLTQNKSTGRINLLKTLRPENSASSTARFRSLFSNAGRAYLLYNKKNIIII